MRIVSWNVNGLRAAIRKDFQGHVRRIKPQVMMLQEVRALPEQLDPEWANPKRWDVSWNPAEKKGYSGVATFSRSPQKHLATGMGGPDPQGRVLVTQIQGITFVNVYLPSGSSKPEAQERKERFMDTFLEWSRAFSASDSPVVIGGDLNIAHTPNDIHNPTGNKRNSGFLPHEREWFSTLLGAGWRDVVREAYPEQKGPYSWWSNRGRARELDRGWRIDYLLFNAPAAKRVVGARIDRRGGLEVSDHAPVIVDLEDGDL
jgi:exodeoxyribonuclease III